MKKIIAVLFSSIILTSTLGQVPNTISQAEKVYGLSKFWQEANYNFAWFEHAPTLNWDSAYIATIPEVLASENDYQYYQVLKKFCALLKDGHTWVDYPPRVDSIKFGNMFGKYRFWVRNIDNKAIIVRTNVNNVDDFPLGSEIIEVDGKPTEDYITQNIMPYISASTDYVRRDYAVESMLRGVLGQKIKIKIRTPKGVRKEFTLIHEKSKILDIIPPFKTPDLFTFKWLDGQIAYIELTDFVNSQTDTLFKEKIPELQKAKGLILDIRNNGGGSSDIGAFIAQYFVNDSVLSASRVRTKVNDANLKAKGSLVKAHDTIDNSFKTRTYKYFHNNMWEELGIDTYRNTVPKTERLKIPTAVLIGHRVASATEEFLLFLDHAKHLTKIGQRTNGSNGQPLLFDLPAGGSARICTQHCEYPDGRQYVGCGIAPDIEVKETVDDVINQKDKVLEVAIDFVKKKL